MCFARGRKQASPGDHVKKISRIFLSVDQKGIYFLGTAQLSLLKSDNRKPIYSMSNTSENSKNGHNVHFRHKWIDCRSVIVYPQLSCPDLRKEIPFWSTQRKILEIFLTWSPGDARFRRAQNTFSAIVPPNFIRFF